MKIVVTGGAGFIGSNFINYELKHHEDDLICFDSLTYAGNLNNLDYYKRSLVRKDIDYVYIFHAMVSTHMQYREGAFDCYKTVSLPCANV